MSTQIQPVKGTMEKRKRYEVKSKGIRIPKGKRGNGLRAKLICFDCKTPVNSIHAYRTKGKIRCFNCNRKYKTIIGSRQYFTLERALNKVYEVHPNVCTNGNVLHGTSSFPRILVGRKFKIQLVDVN